MATRQQPAIAITTDIDTLAARVGYEIDVEADIWAAWDGARKKGTEEPVFRLRERPGVNRDNQETNLLVLCIEGKHAERVAERMSQELERRWKQTVLMEGIATPEPDSRRLRRETAAAQAPPPRDDDKKPKAAKLAARPYGGYAFGVEGPARDFAVRRAHLAGEAPNRKLIVQLVEQGTSVELDAKEDPTSPGSFLCTWTQDNVAEGTAKLDLLENAAGDLALVGTWASKGTPGGFWAFHLFPEDDD